MHKALTQMHVQIHHVISDITGLTGLGIVDAILEGQRDPVELVECSVIVAAPGFPIRRNSVQRVAKRRASRR
jgi:hypothetical protein